MAADGGRRVAAPPRARLVETLLSVDGVHCANCVERLHRVLRSQADRCEVDLATRIATVRHDPDRLSEPALVALLASEGFQPRRMNAAADADEPDHVIHGRRIALARIGVAVIGAMQVMMLAWPAYFGAAPDPDLDALLRWAQLLVATPAVFWSGWPFFTGAAAAWRARTLTMDVPVALSLAIAWSASAVRTLHGSGLLYFDAATMFVALLLVGRFLEASTRAKAGLRLRELATSVPATAQRLLGDSMETVALDRLRLGDRVRVAPGEALPVDGRLETMASLDESLLTGESRPVERRLGEIALAGSLNVGRSPCVLIVSALSGDTRAAGILRLLQRASLRKPRVQALADRIAAHFTLAVLVAAALGGALAAARGIDAALGVMLSVLIVSCPCALSLAVPAVLAAASSRLAARGVLVARTDRLLRLADVDVALLDKTGTLTESRLVVRRCIVEPPHSESWARDVAAALESGLPHPIARAFSRADGRGMAEDVRVEAGRGVSGVVAGRRYEMVSATDAMASTDPGLSWIRLREVGGKDLASFGLGTPLRPEAPGLIASLQDSGIAVEVLTGDSAQAARGLCEGMDVRSIAARQSPEDKLARLRQLQAEGHVVLTVGDGLNDAAFLAAADVSVAMPAGSAITQARADVVLVNERLDGLLLARDVARQARRRVHQNLGWAVAYNLCMLPLAFAGELQPWIAAAGMSMSSLLVVANALRLRMPEAR